MPGGGVVCGCCRSGAPGCSGCRNCGRGSCWRLTTVGDIATQSKASPAASQHCQLHKPACLSMHRVRGPCVGQVLDPGALPRARRASCAVKKDAQRGQAHSSSIRPPTFLGAQSMDRSANSTNLSFPTHASRWQQKLASRAAGHVIRDIQWSAHGNFWPPHVSCGTLLMKSCHEV